jgi:hypothetical protein
MNLLSCSVFKCDGRRQSRENQKTGWKKHKIIFINVVLYINVPQTIYEVYNKTISLKFFFNGNTKHWLSTTVTLTNSYKSKRFTLLIDHLINNEFTSHTMK